MLCLHFAQNAEVVNKEMSLGKGEYAMGVQLLLGHSSNKTQFIQTVKFIFDKNEKGVVVIDNIGFMKSL